MESVSDFVLLLDRLAEAVADVSIPGISLLSKLNTRLASKRAASRFSAACSWQVWITSWSLAATFW